jgi:hypothetical protein
MGWLQLQSTARCMRCGVPSTSAQQTPPIFPKHLVPHFPSLPVDNVRTGFFERAEVEALMRHVTDDGIRDFIEWAFRSAMRKGEIARLTWDMLDRSGSPWILRIPGSITRNRTGRTLGLEGEVRAIIERRLRARRFDNSLDAGALQHRHRARDGGGSAPRGRYLSTQPHERNVEEGQFGDSAVSSDANSLTVQMGVGSSGRIRTENQPSTPADAEQLELDLKGP